MRRCCEVLKRLVNPGRFRVTKLPSLTEDGKFVYKITIVKGRKGINLQADLPSSTYIDDRSRPRLLSSRCEIRFQRCRRWAGIASKLQCRSASVKPNGNVLLCSEADNRSFFGGDMFMWRRQISATMCRNARDTAYYFRLHANRAIELETQIEI